VQIAPSTFYAHRARGFGPTAAELEDAYAADALHDLWTANRSVYGQAKLWHAVQATRGAVTRSPGSCRSPGSPV
jgi:hypothetical protein